LICRFRSVADNDQPQARFCGSANPKDDANHAAPPYQPSSIDLGTALVLLAAVAIGYTTLVAVAEGIGSAVAPALVAVAFSLFAAYF
jgi:hypothetical protein